MRHITRETCWQQLAPAIRQDPNLREDIRNFLREEDARQEWIDDLDQEWVSLVGELGREGERRSELVAVMRKLCADGPERHLPALESYGYDNWFDAGTAQDRFRERFPFLCRLTQALQPMLEDEPVFWAILGPVQDALSFDCMQGFEPRISSARQDFLHTRRNPEKPT